MNELESLIVLNLVKNLGPVRIRRLIKFFGSARAVLKKPPAALERVPGVGPTLARAIARWEKLEYREEFRLIKKMKIKVVSVFDPDYPENLKEIYDPPSVLYLRGNLLPRDQRALAVVGSRRASHYGLQAALKISHQLVNRGFTVVSGLARGIDGHAHRGALMGKGRTIAVLGSGLGNIYPPEHNKLSEEIASSGAVVSEFPVRAVPEKTNFPLRNRIISGLSLGVLVVEAAQRSGALITAQLALDQGRQVMAVPGRIDSFSARGTNQLIQEGAKMVRDADDVLEEFEYLSPPEKPSPESDGSLQPNNMTDEEGKIFALLSEEEKNIEEIIGESGLPSGKVSSILLSLELKRLIKQLPGKFYIKIFPPEKFYNKG